MIGPEILINISETSQNISLLVIIVKIWCIKVLTEHTKHLMCQCLPRACNPLFCGRDDGVIAFPQEKHCLLRIALIQTRQSGLSLCIYNFSPEAKAVEQRAHIKCSGCHISPFNLIQSWKQAKVVMCSNFQLMIQNLSLHCWEFEAFSKINFGERF